VLVQDPPVKGYFNSHDLNWIDDVAYIKSDRLQDFVEGEAACYEEAPCRFIKRSSYNYNKRPGWLSYALYQCQFGTMDRGSKSLCSSQFIEDPSTKPKSSPGSRTRLDHATYHKECQCKFSAIELKPNESIPPDTTKLIFKSRFHVNKQGLPCHGTADQSSHGLSTQMAHSLSSETRYVSICNNCIFISV
jgi:hypothetical protein